MSPLGETAPVGRVRISPGPVQLATRGTIIAVSSRAVSASALKHERLRRFLVAMMVTPGYMAAKPFELALISDPSFESRDLYAALLDDVVAEIDFADDGRDALAKAIARPPRLLVTEARLPFISGFDLCRLLRSIRTQRAQIVLVTSDNTAQQYELAMSAGADAVLTKPHVSAHLLEAITRRSAELIDRSAMTRSRASEQLDRSQALLKRAAEKSANRRLSRVHHRHHTITPPLPPPSIRCPVCDQPLMYERSYVGGVSERFSEQWDYYLCDRGCGRFQYRPRTRRLRTVASA